LEGEERVNEKQIWMFLLKLLPHWQNYYLRWYDSFTWRPPYICEHNVSKRV